jgi:anti-sigma-K factor RskA
MSPSHDSLEQALRAVSHGDLDALTPEQVARLERVLNDEPAVARRVGAQVPQPDAPLSEALDELDRSAQPSRQDWQHVWERIESAAPAAVRRNQAGVSARILRFWRPIAAAAACLLLVGVWKLMPAPADELWPMQLASNVEISDIEVPEGMTSFVVSTSGNNASAIIWVLDDRS